MASVKMGREWDIYLLAGVRSAPTCFKACAQQLRQRFATVGKTPVIRELFPYGDHSQKVWRQLFEVGADLARLRGIWRSGGRETAKAIRRWSSGAPVLLIGHSGGGVAAYCAAVKMMDERVIPDFRIIQVGSPKVPIRPAYRHKVSYYSAVDDNGVCIDPITRLGSWSGLTWNRRRGWRWDNQKYAPAFRSQIAVVGGHAHYFLNEAPYIHPVRGTNLLATLDAIWDVIRDTASMTVASR